MFTIDKLARIPIYEQLISQFEVGILSGDISSDGKLPSVRQLSQQLNINPNTLQRAYNEIEQRGLCYSIPGSGRYLTRDALEKLKTDSLKQTDELRTIMEKLRDRGVTKNNILMLVESVYSVEKHDTGKVDGE